MGSACKCYRTYASVTEGPDGCEEWGKGSSLVNDKTLQIT